MARRTILSAQVGSRQEVLLGDLCRNSRDHSGAAGDRHMVLTTDRSGHRRRGSSSFQHPARGRSCEDHFMDPSGRDLPGSFWDAMLNIQLCQEVRRWRSETSQGKMGGQRSPLARRQRSAKSARRHTVLDPYGRTMHIDLRPRRSMDDRKPALKPTLVRQCDQGSGANGGCSSGHRSYVCIRLRSSQAHALPREL